MKLIFVIFMILEKIFQGNSGWPDIFAGFQVFPHKVSWAINSLYDLSEITRNMDKSFSRGYQMIEAISNYKNLRFGSNLSSISKKKINKMINQLAKIKQITLVIQINEIKKLIRHEDMEGNSKALPHKNLKITVNIEGFPIISQENSSPRFEILWIISVIVIILLNKTFWKSTIFIFLLSLANAQTIAIGDLMVFISC